MKGIRRWFRLGSVERDVDEEIAFHLEEVAQDLTRQGVDPAAARAAAARQFGDHAFYRQQLVRLDRGTARRERWRQRRELWWHTARHATRAVVRTPGLSLGIVAALALGLGANATMYETVERMLLKPPPHITDADQVRRLLIQRDFGGERRYGATLAFPDYVDFTEVAGFSHVAAVARRDVTIGAGESAERVPAVLATASYWPLLGVQPALGRFFGEAEDRFGADGVVVLSWRRWQAQYGGSADVLGRTVDFGYGPWTIIGVAPKGFTGVELSPVDLWMPLMPAGEKLQGLAGWAEERDWYFLQALARLDPAHAVAAVEAEATVRHRAGRREDAHPDSLARVMAAPLLEARGPNAPSEAAVAKWLLGVAAVVLLIACLNVANLLLARMLRQRRELAVRLALGSSRARLVAQVVAEGVLLGLLGGAAALALARWGGTVVQRTLLPDIDWSGGPSTTLLLFVLGLSVLAGALSAVAPALQASRRDLADGVRGAGGISRSSARARATLTAVQAALSLLLLVGAGLFVRSLDRVHRTDFGIALWELAYVSPSYHAGTMSPEERSRFLDDAAERVRRLPGVTSASAAMGIPFWSAYGYPLRVEGRDSLPRLPAGGPYANQVDPHYFTTMGLRLQRGRLFDERDRTGSQPVAIVNTTFAAHAWPGADALGRCIHILKPPPDGLPHDSRSDDAPCILVVGIVNDARRDALVENVSAQYYLPLAQELATGGAEALLVRVPDQMPAILAAVQREMLALDGRVRFVRTVPVEDLVAGELRQWRLGAALFTLFGLLALAVAALGLYSVLAFDVAQRTREIGLRTALGAPRGAIIRLVMSRSLRITAAGTAAGLAGALLLAPRLRDMLYQVSPFDPLTHAVVVATLGLVSLIAAWLPAWRAARVDPNVALRAD